jgi:hypothetical protein
VTWTGSELLVVGGGTPASVEDPDGAALHDGAAYDPATRTWQLGVPPPDSLPARAHRTALTTGHEVFVWAGSTDGGAPVALSFTPPQP